MGNPVSQRAIETLLGRMLTDAAFREQFFAEPAVACAEHGFDLTVAEVSALLRLDRGAMDELATRLDRRIVRAAVGQPAAGRGARSAAQSEPRRGTR